jgi:hypothetical protein
MCGQSPCHSIGPHSQTDRLEELLIGLHDVDRHFDHAPSWCCSTWAPCSINCWANVTSSTSSRLRTKVI